MTTLMLSTVYEQSERPAVSVGSCCARAVQLLVLYILGHQYVELSDGYLRQGLLGVTV